MKQNKIFGLFLLVTLGCSSSRISNPNLYDLYKKKQFLELEVSNTNRDDKLYYFYKAIGSNVSNRPTESNQYLDSLLAISTYPDSLAYDFWLLRNDNYVKTFDYQNALSSSETLLNNFSHTFNEEKLKEEINSKKIWQALALQQPQKVFYTNEVEIPVEIDMAKLPNIPVKSDSTTMNFVFDTGAGISSIMESLAIELGFTFMEDFDIKIKGFNGIYNPIRIAVAKELIIEGVKIENAPFLVFKDEALTFANGAYKINGIIGFPIIKDLGTIKVEKNKLTVYRGKRDESEIEKNLFIEMMHPIVSLKYKEKPLPFIFDTGAMKTRFSKTFYETFQSEIDQKGQIEQKKMESAGGVLVYNSMTLNQFQLKLGIQNVEFPSIDVDLDNYHTMGSEYYGNIGQDLLQQYEIVTISFDQNYLRLENKIDR
jgi:hypothetical protein